MRSRLPSSTRATPIGVHGWIVDNQIGKHWPEFYRRVGEVAAAVANARRVRKEAQGMGDFVQHMSRYTRPSFGQIKIPDVEEVLLRLGRETVASRH